MKKRQAGNVGAKEAAEKAAFYKTGGKRLTLKMKKKANKIARREKKDALRESVMDIDTGTGAKTAVQTPKTRTPKARTPKTRAEKKAAGVREVEMAE